MYRWLRTAALIVAAAGGLAPAGRADLAHYISRPEPQYHWEKVSETQEGFISVTDLKLRSQVWRGIPWDHTLRLYQPVTARHPKTALLLITGGNPGTEETQLASIVVNAVQAPVAILYNIPNQPLFGGKTEDNLISYTYGEFLKSGDDTWPLLEPMTKSAVKAMDALQEYSAEQGQKIEDFVVIGASKRGWTTYLTGAVDPRVKAIVPIVFEDLNFAVQMPHELALWGHFSAEIEPYTRLGIQQQLTSKRGRKLLKMVDPWYYRDHLKMPKLLINGANDAYWAADAVSLYWDELPGDKALVTVPNSGHKLEDRSRLLATALAFLQHVIGGSDFPRLTFTNSDDGSRRTVRVQATSKPVEARLWVARSDTLEFQDSTWEAVPMSADGDAYVGQVTVPEKGGIAWFGELTFSSPAGLYTLCTPTRLAPEPVSRNAPRAPRAARTPAPGKTPAPAG